MKENKMEMDLYLRACSMASSSNVYALQREYIEKVSQFLSGSACSA
jgi:hypothetical protein